MTDMVRCHADSVIVWSVVQSTVSKLAHLVTYGFNSYLVADGHRSHPHSPEHITCALS